MHGYWQSLPTQSVSYCWKSCFTSEPTVELDFGLRNLTDGSCAQRLTLTCEWLVSVYGRCSQDIPLTFELPMVLFTRAILLLNQAKCVSRSRDREEIPQAATFCLEAAGIFDHILELMNANLMEGLEPPCSLPDLSLDVLQSLQGVCLAIVSRSGGESTWSRLATHLHALCTCD